MTAIEEMAGMDVLCSDKTGTLTLNKLSVDKNIIEVLILFFLVPTIKLKLKFISAKIMETGKSECPVSCIVLHDIGDSFKHKHSILLLKQEYSIS